MTADEIRAHVVIPKALGKKIDALVGPRQRSKFIVEATTREVARLELLEAAEAAAGSLPKGTVPEWDTSESAAQWVHDSRQLDNDRQERLEELGHAPPKHHEPVRA